jgi:hypothetical protein
MRIGSFWTASENALNADAKTSPPAPCSGSGLERASAIGRLYNVDEKTSSPRPATHRSSLSSLRRLPLPAERGRLACFRFLRDTVDDVDITRQERLDKSRCKGKIGSEGEEGWLNVRESLEDGSGRARPDGERCDVFIDEGLNVLDVTLVVLEEKGRGGGGGRGGGYPRVELTKRGQEGRVRMRTRKGERGGEVARRGHNERRGMA